MAFPPLICLLTWTSSSFSPAKTFLMSSVEISTGISGIIPLCDLLSIGEQIRKPLVFLSSATVFVVKKSTTFPSLLVKVKSSLTPGKWVNSLRFWNTLEERISSTIVPEMYSVCSSGYLRTSNLSTTNDDAWQSICKKFDVEVLNGQLAIMSDMCSIWFHEECSRLSKKQLNVIGEIDTCKWFFG